MDRATQKWIEIAEYDLKTAAAMLKSKRYLYVVFMCQQAIEKILKAIYVQQNKNVPPRTHNLLYLADTLKLQVSASDKSLLFDLNQFYISTRYPQDRRRISKTVTQKKAKMYFENTKGVFQCFRKMLPSGR